MSKERKKLMLIRPLYPEANEKFQKHAKLCPEDKQIANDIIFDTPPWRIISLFFEKHFEMIEVFITAKEYQKKWEKKFFPETPANIRKICEDEKGNFLLDKEAHTILAKQIIYYKPDIFINTLVKYISSELLRKLKEILNFKLIGYHSAETIDESILKPYDFIFSPFLPTVIQAKSAGVRAELIHLGFDKDIFNFCKPKHQKERKYDVVFVGSFHHVHQSRKKLIEKVAEHFGEKFFLWTQSESSLTSTLKKRFMGKVIGKEMFQILSNSKIVVNHHGDILPWAHNLRLFEATGMGCLLITDDLPGLDILFEPEREVITYHTPEDCIYKIEKFLQDENAREKIALAGQKRTLKDHLYINRATKLLEIIEKL